MPYQSGQPSPHELMGKIPYDERRGGSPAGDAIRALIQQGMIKRNEGSLRFQKQQADQNAAATQPFQDEPSPQMLQQQAQQTQAPQMQAPQSGQPAPPGPPQQPPVNPGQSASNPAMTLPPATGATSLQQESQHVGGPKFQKGRRYVG